MGMYSLGIASPGGAIRLSNHTSFLRQLPENDTFIMHDLFTADTSKNIVSSANTFTNADFWASITASATFGH
jgi:hypothetical protein